MKRFARLYRELDATTSINAKVAALSAYLSEADQNDSLWAVALILGRTPRRAVTARDLRQWGAEAAGLAPWLFEECYAMVGDLAETIALVLPAEGGASDRSLSAWMAEIEALAKMDPGERRRRVEAAWRELAPGERFLFNKLVTGGLRVGVSQKLLSRALAAASGLAETLVAERLMGDWTPRSTTFAELLEGQGAGTSLSPFPFHLAYPLEAPLDALGEPEAWHAEMKWDGIRAQLVVRGGEAAVWSRGEELVTARFPEIAGLAPLLLSQPLLARSSASSPADGVVIDGEIVAWRDGAPLPFQALQKRIGRRSVSRKLLADAPVVLVAYDLLEHAGEDMRAMAFGERRRRLASLLSTLPAAAPVRLSPAVAFRRWDELPPMRQAAPSQGCEGLMLKRLASPYRAGRRKGDWWKWKVDPLSVDAVMVYAQAGHGRRANLYTDFTFAVWDAAGELVPFAKAYSGLTDDEFAEITAWVRRNTLERFGPVRRVTPELVFEIAFEGIQRSTRHKSGIALRFPRIARWRRDKPLAEAGTLRELEDLLAAHGQ